MRNLFLLAGAGMLLAFGAPADAKPKGPKGNKATVVKVAPAKVKPAQAKPAKVRAKTWLTACPPGLVWRSTVCVPPGHAKKLLVVGTRVPRGWSYTPWGAVPMNLRTHYDLDPAFRYIHRDNLIYVIDPRTRLITSIIDAVL